MISFRYTQGGYMMEKTYEVRGMTCVICKANVEKALKSVEGVDECKVNLLENEATVVFDENIADEQKLSKAVKDSGYELVISKDTQLDMDKVVMIVSVVLMLILMCFSMGHMIGIHTPEYGKYLQLILCTVISIMNRRYYRSGFL